jgi:hypothetical protein
MTPWDPQVAMQEVADGIRQTWQSRADSPFANVVWDEQQHRLTVYRVPGHAEFDRDVLSRTTSHVGVVLADCAWTEGQLRVMSLAVLEATELPMRVYGAGPRPDSNGVDCWGEGDLDAAQQILDARYGPGTVTTRQGGPARLL